MNSGSFISAGIVTVFLGFILIFIGLIVPLATERNLSGRTRVAVGGFIGPIPFGFANDTRLFLLVLLVSALIAAVWLLSFLRRGYIFHLLCIIKAFLYLLHGSLP